MTPLRRARVAAVKRLRKKGMSSAAIARELGIAPSTVRDYASDPTGAKRRKRQRRYAVEGVSINGTPIAGLKAPPWKSGGPARGVGVEANRRRGRQMQAIIGHYYRGR